MVKQYHQEPVYQGRILLPVAANGEMLSWAMRGVHHPYELHRTVSCPFLLK